MNIIYGVTYNQTHAEANIKVEGLFTLNNQFKTLEEAKGWLATKGLFLSGDIQERTFVNYINQKVKGTPLFETFSEGRAEGLNFSSYCTLDTQEIELDSYIDYLSPRSLESRVLR